MKRLALLTLPVVLLAGCNYHDKREVRVRIDPDIASHSVRVSCLASSTGKCFVSISGSHPSRVVFEVDHVITVANVDPGAGYCMEVRGDLLDRCTPDAVPEHKVTVTRTREVTYRQPE
jgi:hypothetical protein